MLPEALNRKFGIEFEYPLPGLHNSLGAVVNAIDSIVPVCNPEYWEEFDENDYSDTTIAPDDWTIGYDSGGIELRTPPSTHRDWYKIGQVLNVLRPHGRWSRECGTHIHLDASDCSSEDRMNFVRWWVSLESLFMTMVHRSRRDNCYCPSVESALYEDSREWAYHWTEVRQALFDRRRYSWALQRFGRQAIAPLTGHNTIEVRLHHATLNKSRIKHWIWTMQILLWHAKNTRLSQTDLTSMRPMPNADKLALLGDIILTHAGSRRSRKLLAHLNERIARYA